MSAEVIELPAEVLVIGDDVRLDEDVDDLAALAVSVSEIGVLHPLVVRPTTGSHYEVISGRRRLAAARIADLPTLPCIVRELDDEAAFELTLAENLHRRNLSWIELALAYERMRSTGMQQQEIARRVGKSQTQVCHILQLLTIPEELQQRVQRREIGYVHALDLAKRGRKGGSGNPNKRRLPSGYDGELATHWRRRHDRMVAGIRAVLAVHPSDDEHWRALLERLLQLDVQPLPEAEDKTPRAYRRMQKRSA